MKPLLDFLAGAKASPPMPLARGEPPKGGSALDPGYGTDPARLWQAA